MATGQVFATRWDFLLARVLIGVDRTTGVFSGSEPAPGLQMVCVWTSREVAEEALHVESWDLRPIAMRELLRLVPDGVGVVIDPERPSGMTASASYVANMARYVEPFPTGSQVRLAEWETMPDAMRAAVVGAVSGDDTVRELHAFTYTVDDSPRLGCLAHACDGGADPSAVTGRIEAAVSAAAGRDAPDVPTVIVLGLDDLPPEVRAALDPPHVVHRRRDRRRWWR